MIDGFDKFCNTVNTKLRHEGRVFFDDSHYVDRINTLSDSIEEVKISLADISGQLRTIDKDASHDEEFLQTIKDELQKIAGFAQVRQCGIDDQGHLFVITAPLAMRNFRDPSDVRFLGVMRITFNLASPTDITFQNLSSGGNPHPHHNGRPCLGQASELIGNAAISGKVSEIVSAAIAWLLNFDPEDPWGRKGKKYARLDQSRVGLDGTVIPFPALRSNDNYVLIPQEDVSKAACLFQSYGYDLTGYDINTGRNKGRVYTEINALELRDFMKKHGYHVSMRSIASLGNVSKIVISNYNEFDDIEPAKTRPYHLPQVFLDVIADYEHRLGLPVKFVDPSYYSGGYRHNIDKDCLTVFVRSCHGKQGQNEHTFADLKYDSGFDGGGLIKTNRLGKCFKIGSHIIATPTNTFLSVHTSTQRTVFLATILWLESLCNSHDISLSCDSSTNFVSQEILTTMKSSALERKKANILDTISSKRSYLNDTIQSYTSLKFELEERKNNILISRNLISPWILDIAENENSRAAYSEKLSPYIEQIINPQYGNGNIGFILRPFEVQDGDNTRVIQDTTLRVTLTNGKFYLVFYRNNNSLQAPGFFDNMPIDIVACEAFEAYFNDGEFATAFEFIHHYIRESAKTFINDLRKFPLIETENA